MPYAIVRTPLARRDIRDLIRYLLREAGPRIAGFYFDALEHDIEVVIANAPNAFPWFHETGAPYRAKLFKLARTTYWIIYIVDEARKQIQLIRVWNTAREPVTHGL